MWINNLLHNYHNAVSCSKSKTKYTVETVGANAKKGVSLFFMSKKAITVLDMLSRDSENVRLAELRMKKILHPE